MLSTKKIKKKFRIKQVGKHTRKLTGAAGLDIGKTLSNALKEAKKNWDAGVRLTQDINPPGAKLEEALKNRGVNVPKVWTNKMKKEHLAEDGDEFKIISENKKTKKYNDLYYSYSGAFAHAHIHVYGSHGAGFHPLTNTDINIQQNDLQRLGALTRWEEAVDKLGERNIKANWKTFFRALRPLLRRNASDDEGSSSTAPLTIAQHVNDLLIDAQDGWVIAKSIAARERDGLDISIREHAERLTVWDKFCKSTRETLMSPKPEDEAFLLEQIQAIKKKIEQLTNNAFEHAHAMLREISRVQRRSFLNDLRKLITYIFMIKWCASRKKYSRTPEEDATMFINNLWDKNIDASVLWEDVDRNKITKEDAEKIEEEAERVNLGRPELQEALQTDFVQALMANTDVRVRMKKETQEAERKRLAAEARLISVQDGTERRLYNGAWLTEKEVKDLYGHNIVTGNKWSTALRTGISGGKSTRKRKKNQRRKTKQHRR